MALTCNRWLEGAILGKWDLSLGGGGGNIYRYCFFWQPAKIHGVPRHPRIDLDGLPGCRSPCTGISSYILGSRFSPFNNWLLTQGNIQMTYLELNFVLNTQRILEGSDRHRKWIQHLHNEEMPDRCYSRVPFRFQFRSFVFWYLALFLKLELVKPRKLFTPENMLLEFKAYLQILI